MSYVSLFENDYPGPGALLENCLKPVFGSAQKFLLCDAFLPSYHAPLSLRQEQEKNRAAAGGREAARHGRRAVPF
jgi:hypothetical protein